MMLVIDLVDNQRTAISSHLADGVVAGVNNVHIVISIKCDPRWEYEVDL